MFIRFQIHASGQVRAQEARSLHNHTAPSELPKSLVAWHPRLLPAICPSNQMCCLPAHPPTTAASHVFGTVCELTFDGHQLHPSTHLVLVYPFPPPRLPQTRNLQSNLVPTTNCIPSAGHSIQFLSPVKYSVCTVLVLASARALKVHETNAIDRRHFQAPLSLAQDIAHSRLCLYIPITFGIYPQLLNLSSGHCGWESK